MTLQAWNSFEFDSLGWASNNGVMARSAGTGQSGLASIRGTAGAAGDFFYGFTSAAEVIHGFCWKHSFGADHFFNLWPGGYNGGFFHFALEVLGSGAVRAYSDNFTNNLGTSATGIFAANVEAYVEVRVVASTGSSGEVEVYVNGAQVLNLSGLDTGAGSFDTVGFRGTGGTRDFSAWYYVIPDATPPNDFLGHIRFGVLDPDGNGASSQFVGDDGNSTNNYLHVDDGSGGSITSDSDTTYVQSSTVDQQDTYAHEALPSTPASIIAVCPRFTAKKTESGTRSMKFVTRSDGADYEGADEHFLGTSYNVFKEALLVDPDTSTDWTEAGVNAAEFGFKVES